MEDKLRIDGHKLNYHPDRIMPWVKGKDIYPVYVEIGPTSICNHRCIFCALDYTGYKGKLMDTQVLLNALTEMGKKGVKSIMFGGEGEPTLHKDFSLLVEHAKKNGLDVSFCEIEAEWGHDAFLLPNERLAAMVKGFLDRVYSETRY